MSRLIRSIKEQFRERMGSSKEVDERRVAPRLENKRDRCLLFSLTVKEAPGRGINDPDGALRPHSRHQPHGAGAGSAAAARRGERFDQERPPFVNGTGTAFRADSLSGQASALRGDCPEGEEGVVLGVHITSISESARSRLDEFLRQAHRRRPLSGELSPQDKKVSIK